MIQNEIVCQAIGDEFLVFHPTLQEIHCLSGEARFVLEQFPSSTGPFQLVSSFRERFPQHAETAPVLIEGILSGLRERGLIENSNSSLSKPGRRALLKVAGITLITSILAPPPVAAASTPLQFVSAVYTGPDITNCPGPNVGSGTSLEGTTILNCLRSLQSPTSVTYRTYPNGTGAACNSTGLNIADPIVGTRKSMTIGYRCSGGPVQYQISCDFDVNTITCP